MLPNRFEKFDDDVIVPDSTMPNVWLPLLHIQERLHPPPSPDDKCWSLRVSGIDISIRSMGASALMEDDDRSTLRTSPPTTHHALHVSWRHNSTTWQYVGDPLQNGSL